MKLPLRVAIAAITISALLAVYWTRHAVPPPVVGAAKPVVPAQLKRVANRASLCLGNVTPEVPAPESVPVADSEFMWRDVVALQLVYDIELTISAVDDPQREESLQKLVSAIVRHDAATAGFLAENWEPGSVRQELLRRVARTWAATDPVGVIAWVVSLKDEGDRKSTAMDACEQIAEADPLGAVHAGEFLELDGYKGTMEDLVQRWANDDFAAALSWARSRPADEQRAKSLARLALVQAQTDPVSAATMVVREVAPGADQDEAVLTVLHAWAGKDLSAATAWVNQFPEGPLREQATYEIAALAPYPENEIVPEGSALDRGHIEKKTR